MNPDPPVAKPPPRRWRRWLKRSLWTLLGLIVILVIFHRPILRFAMQHAAPAFAKSSGMEVTWDVDGSVIGDIDISNLKVTGDATAPLQKLTARRVRADYSLWSLVKKGLGPFLGGAGAELEDVELVLDTNKFPPPKNEVKEPGPPPALELPKLTLKNVNARIILADGEVTLRGLNFTLQPGGSGLLEFADLQLPQNLPRLQNVKGTTEAGTKKLTLRALQLQPNLTVDELTVDLKDLDKSSLAFVAALTVPGGKAGTTAAAGPGNQKTTSGSGTVNITGTLEGIGKTPSLNADAILTNLTPASLQPWVSLPKDLNWSVPELRGTVSGDPGAPRTLKATVAASIAGFSIATVKADTAQLEASLDKGILTVRQLDIANGNNHLVARATGQMPETWNDFSTFQLKADADVNAPQIETFFSKDHAPLTGSVTGKLNATLTNGIFTQGQANLRGSSLAILIPVTPEATGAAQPTTTEITKVPVETLELAATTNGKMVQAERVKVLFDAQNTVDASGSFEFSGPQALQVTWSADLPNVERISNWLAAVQLPGLAGGWLRGAGQVTGNIADWQRADFSQTTAETKLTASNLAWRSGRAESLSLDTSTGAGRVTLRNFSAVMNDRNKIVATGTADLKPPYQFSGRVDGDLSQLADFEPWLNALGVKGPMAGKARIAWEGSGQAANFSLNGGGTVTVEAFKFAAMKEPATLTLKTSHTGKQADIATLDLTMGDLKITAPGTITETSFDVPAIRVSAAKLTPIEGHVKVPLDFAQVGGLAGPVSMTKPLDVGLVIKDWDLAEVVRAAGLTLKAKGKVNADVKIAGTLPNPSADVDVDLKGVSVLDIKQKIEPTDASLKLNLKDRKLTGVADVKQKNLQPLHAAANTMTLDVGELLKGKNSDALEKLALNVDVTLPDSELNALKPFVSDLNVNSITGKFGLNARIRGTVGKPQITGDLRANSPAITFKSGETPPIRNMNVRIRFDGTRVFIEEAGAMMSGGTLGARGTVDWTNTKNPVIDATLTAQQALVVRDDSISMRADGVISCRGSLEQATVTGRVELVRGRIYKEIEFLPLSLPNQLPPPPPPSTPVTNAPPSLPPPLDKWTFNVDIVTREPVRFLGNVLNGGAVSALKLTGTGAKLALEGKVSLRDARVRLPFSRLTVSRGEVLFSKDKPFEPVLDLQGDSFVNGYQVTLNAYGDALDPKIRFSSSPPLPEGEIATLLATGSTSGDLKDGQGEAANRAAFLVISRAYRKLFHKRALVHENDEPPRLSFSFSPLENGSGGGRSFSALYEINEHLQAVGSMSQRGSFRGLLYYLIRFR